MVTGGSNTAHHARLQDSIQPLILANERARVNYFYEGALPYDPELLERTTIPVIHRRRTVEEVRRQMISDREADRRSGFRYPTAAEVEEIQRRFHNPELQNAMERAAREYIAQMTRMISEPAPPGYREAMEAARNAD